MAKSNEESVHSEPVQLLLGAIRKQFGKGAVIDLNGEALPGVEWLRSGSMALDAALGNGYARGRMVELYGAESAGKTTLLLQAIAEAQKDGLTCAILDTEHALDMHYARALGIDTDKLIFSQPDNAEQALDMLDMMIRSGVISLIGIDSTSALVPRAELEGEVGDNLPGLQARLLSKSLRNIVGPAYQTKTTVIWISQIRKKLGVIFGSPEVVGVGEALKFYASQRLDIRRTGTLKDGDESLANAVKVTVKKNKVAPPYKVAEFNIIFGKGIDTQGELLDVAVARDVVDKAGAWYSFQGERIGQGRKNTLEFLEQNPDIMERVKTGLNEIHSEE